MLQPTPDVRAANRCRPGSVLLAEPLCRLVGDCPGPLRLAGLLSCERDWSGWGIVCGDGEGAGDYGKRHGSKHQEGESGKKTRKR